MPPGLSTARGRIVRLVLPACAVWFVLLAIYQGVLMSAAVTLLVFVIFSALATVRTTDWEGERSDVRARSAAKAAKRRGEGPY